MDVHTPVKLRQVVKGDPTLLDVHEAVTGTRLGSVRNTGGGWKAYVRGRTYGPELLRRDAVAEVLIQYDA